jgi:hypothetical protein
VNEASPATYGELIAEALRALDDAPRLAPDVQSVPETLALGASRALLYRAASRTLASFAVARPLPRASGSGLLITVSREELEEVSALREQLDLAGRTPASLGAIGNSAVTPAVTSQCTRAVLRA